MISNPTDLYSKLISDYKLPELSLCDLHKPCSNPAERRCNAVLKHKIINFDDVKIEFQRGKQEVQKASVDGFTYKNAVFCFVELKGWKDFLIYHTNPNTLSMEIKEQVDKYDLTKKLTDSMIICKDVAANADLFTDMSVAFILVTDIEINEDASMEFYSNLMYLAETSSNWENICNIELKDKLSTLPSTINKYYIRCCHFDNMISKL